MKNSKIEPDKKKLRARLIVLCAFSVAVGSAWGARTYLERESRAGKADAGVTIRVLTIRGLFPPALLEKFEKSAGIRVSLTEAPDPEALWEKLEAAPSAKDEGFDLVSLFSYQTPLAFQLSRAQPMKTSKLRGFSQTAPDLRELPGSTSFHFVLPLLWGLNGMAFDPSKTQAPDSWQEALSDSDLKGKIALPSSTVDLERLLGTVAPGAPAMQKALGGLLAKAKIAEDFWDPASLLELPVAPAVAMVSSGRAAFPPWSTGNWKFTIPEEGATLWILSLAIHSEMKNEASVYSFLDFLLGRESAEALTAYAHQASANRLLEASPIDARLKPSFLRQVPLTKIDLWKDISRSRELRALLMKPKPD